jgi:hypothetical protein
VEKVTRTWSEIQLKRAKLGAKLYCTEKILYIPEEIPC